MADSSLDAVRRELAVLAKNPKLRTLGWEAKVPCDWRPETVRDPRSKTFFTAAGAWDFIAELLESGTLVREKILNNPAGETAYELKFELEPDCPKLYIKIQLGVGKIIGRSFHYDK